MNFNNFDNNESEEILTNVNSTSNANRDINNNNLSPGNSSNNVTKHKKYRFDNKGFAVNFLLDNLLLIFLKKVKINFNIFFIFISLLFSEKYMLINFFYVNYFVRLISRMFFIILLILLFAQLKTSIWIKVIVIVAPVIIMIAVSF